MGTGKTTKLDRFHPSDPTWFSHIFGPFAHLERIKKRDYAPNAYKNMIDVKTEYENNRPRRSNGLTGNKKL